MRLTWKDGVTTLLAALVAITYAAHAYGWAVPIVDDARGATLAIGGLGLAMCIVDSNPAAITARSGYAVLMSALGGAALLLVIIGLITGWSLAVSLIAIDTLVMYGVATAKHGLGAPDLKHA